MVSKELFGKLPDGSEVNRYTITNRFGESAGLLDFGATIHDVTVLDKDGKLGDVVLGAPADAIAQCTYMGSIIGRYSGRVPGGKCMIDGKSHQLEQNLGEDFCHGASGNYARNDFAAEGMDGTAVEQAIYRRNQVMKETWGVDIKNEDITRFGSAGGTGDGYTKIYTDYMAGDANYDAAMIGTYDVATLAYSGYIHDLCDIPHIDLTKSWWDQKANKDLSIRGRMFYTTGDISVVDNMVTHALLFNKDMIESYGLDNPYDLVADDNWNLETFGALVKQVGQDLDNNGVYDENDLYGLLTWNDPMTAILAARRSPPSTTAAS